jgi:hypothetical protein
MDDADRVAFIAPQRHRDTGMFVLGKTQGATRCKLAANRSTPMKTRWLLNPL